MSDMQTLMHVTTGRDGVLSRRTFFRSVAAGAAGLGLLGWKDALTLHAQELRRQGKSCILLFMRGGPSQFETFDPKPGHANGGPTQAINTAVSGVRIAEHWPNVAQQMRDIALIRSMNNREGEHQRATYQMHTGYIPAGGVRHPSIGAIVASEIGPRDFDLPHFVSVGNRFTTMGSGFLGMQFAPFVVANPNQMPSNVELPGGVNSARYDRRLNLMTDLERDFAESGGQSHVQSHRALVTSAAAMVRSPRLRAFDLSQETQAIRRRYGSNAFGQGCLLARRLVEAGVTFVEVDSNGWDTHQDNFERTRTLSGGVDSGFAALVQDLRERGRLERTLVIWMGEFGRTPRINGNNGRDHFPRAFNIALAGCGIRGGQVLGATSAGGNDITNRPVGVADLFCTFCHALNINPRKENMTPIGRPIRIVDGGETVRELF
ncbi:MAG: DUF1501 domain-containing protein [Gemmataceae bacterium]|nr:DUF1501 domain-containing protein [Gemmataceae bacterium]MCI0743672.1 DUF1501 domain-containing protein [Gemmataceae bacterium]